MKLYVYVIAFTHLGISAWYQPLEDHFSNLVIPCLFAAEIAKVSFSDS